MMTMTIFGIIGGLLMAATKRFKVGFFSLDWHSRLRPDCPGSP
jgi:hypothetical protein